MERPKTASLGIRRPIFSLAIFGVISSSLLSAPRTRRTCLRYCGGVDGMLVSPGIAGQILDLTGS